LAMSGHLAHADAGAVAIVGLMDPKEMREQINKLGTDMKAITDKAKDEKREKLTREEEIAFDKMDADRETLIADERRALRMQELENPTGRRAAPLQPSTESRGTGGSLDREKLAEDHNDALRAWFASNLDMPLTPQQHELCKRLGINPQSRSIN